MLAAQAANIDFLEVLRLYGKWHRTQDGRTPTMCIRVFSAAVKPRDQVRCDRAVGGAHPAWRRHDGADTVPVHQPLDPATACATSLLAQTGMDARTAVTPAAVLMDLPDRGQEAGIGFGPLAHRAIDRDAYPVRLMCAVLEVSPAGYYAWRVDTCSRLIEPGGVEWNVNVSHLPKSTSATR